MDQNKTPIIDMLRRFGEISPGYFCIPSHHRGSGADPHLTDLMGNKFLKYDLTETPLTDDLHEAEGPIKEAEDMAAEAFGADRTFFLVNGTTCGNEAMIISSVREGEKILVAENCHKSVLMGIIISGAIPIFIRPALSSAYHTYASISPKSVEEAFEKNSGIKALIMTSPTYHGICSDLESIAEICHRHHALLLVDEAHGAHFAFNGKLPKTALSSGADLVSQSIHKTAGSMTQSSMLHVNGTSELISSVSAALKIVQSTSPSYILMASLDGARHSMAINGQRLTDNMLGTASLIRDGINSIDGAFCCGSDAPAVFDHDRTRVVFGIKTLSGFDLSDILFRESGICTEMCDGHNVVAVTGPGDTEKDAQRLIDAVRSAALKYGSGDDLPQDEYFPALPPMAATPRKAFFSDTERIPFENSIGRISAEMIAPYPPGIPVIYPGQIMTPEIHSYISEALRKKRHIHGFSDGCVRTIKVIK